MAKYVAISKVRIGDGSILNEKSSNDHLRGTSKFEPGDEADLTAAQAKQYAAFFKAQKTSANKEKKTGKNK